MNRDQVKGTAKDVEGKVQREVGKATGDLGEQVKGAGKQVEGKIQKGIGNLKDDVDKNRDPNRR
ncbi:MAG: CsbD family protein [Casimicrobiaceae bacterium]